MSMAPGTGAHSQQGLGVSSHFPRGSSQGKHPHTRARAVHVSVGVGSMCTQDVCVPCSRMQGLRDVAYPAYLEICSLVGEGQVGTKNPNTRMDYRPVLWGSQ